MKKDFTAVLSAELIGDEIGLTLAELCLSFHLSDAEIWELVDEGIIEPHMQKSGQWHFDSASLRRIRCALQLNRDLGVNWAGAALALELLEELKPLRARLRQYEGM